MVNPLIDPHPVLGVFGLMLALWPKKAPGSLGAPAPDGTEFMLADTDSLTDTQMTADTDDGTDVPLVCDEE